MKNTENVVNCDDGSERKEKLIEITGNNTIVSELVEEIIYLEQQLVEVKKYPFLRVNPNNPNQQKSTPAAKLYKELLQQYNNCLRLLFKVCGQDEGDEESPLRKWVKQFVGTRA